MRLVPPESKEPAHLEFVWTERGQVPESPRAGKNDTVVKLADIRFVPFVSKNYRERSKVMRFADLAKHHVISMPAYRWFSADGWTDWHGLVDISDDRAIVVEGSASVAYLAAGGAGAGLLPTYSPVCMENLLAVNVSVPRMIGTLWLVQGAEDKRDAAARRCFTTLRRLFHEAEWMNDTGR
jgi:DNA-binding transcriptional LysR family regulator